MWHTRVITKQSKITQPTKTQLGTVFSFSCSRYTLFQNRVRLMDASPCNCWNHVTKPPSPSHSSSELWKDLKLSSLSNCSVDMDAASSSPWFSLCSSHHSLLSSFNTSFDTSSSSGEKRAQQDHVYAFSDQRRKRILKNRESALRSRARKQAYKKGLEMKLALLTEENSRLRTQLTELQFCLSSAKPTKVGAVYRTMSSPF